MEILLIIACPKLGEVPGHGSDIGQIKSIKNSFCCSQSFVLSSVSDLFQNLPKRTFF
eukprot:c40453_g1_i1 orf=63-233(-)